MTPTIEKVLDSIATLEAYYDKTLNDVQLKLMSTTLQKFALDDDGLDRVIAAWIEGNKWFPRISELVELSRTLPNPNESRELYWQAMALFNLSMAGEISEADLFNDRTWKWFKRRQGTGHTSDCPCRICAGEITHEELDAIVMAESVLEPA